MHRILLHAAVLALGLTAVSARAEEPYQTDSLAVNYKGGNVLPDANGGALRATRIRVYAKEVDWHFSGKADSHITTPWGRGGSAAGSFQYPGFKRYGIVLFQHDLPGYNVIGTGPENAQVFDVSDGHDIIVNVNDNEYDDNYGSFKLVVEVLQR